jgi:hypothetical protein
MRIGMHSDSGNINPAALQVNKEHDVGHESSQREDLYSERIGAGQHCKVSPNELCPGRRPLALRRGRYTVTAQNIADRLITDMISQIGQRPDNPVITPGSRTNSLTMPITLQNITVTCQRSVGSTAPSAAIG